MTPDNKLGIFPQKLDLSILGVKSLESLLATKKISNKNSGRKQRQSVYLIAQPNIGSKKLTMPPVSAKPKKKKKNSTLTMETEAIIIELSYCPWTEQQERLDKILEESALDPLIEQRIVRYSITRDEFDAYFQWQTVLFRKYKYPIGISIRSKGHKREPINRGFDMHHFEIGIENWTMREEEIKAFVYQFFEGKCPSAINLEILYDLIRRSILTKADFAKGKYDYQNSVYIKAVQLKSDELTDSIKEIQTKTQSILEKILQPFVVIVFSLPENASFTTSEVQPPHRLFTDRICLFGNQIYLFKVNNQRKMLDLHGHSEFEAKARVKAYIIERYHQNDRRCTIITGRGNHTNPNTGAVAVLFNSFPEWMKELSSYVELFKPRDGCYSVVLKQPIVCNLTKSPFLDMLLIVRAMREAIKNQVFCFRIRMLEHETPDIWMLLFQTDFFKQIRSVSIQSSPDAMQVFFSLKQEGIANQTFKNCNN